MDMIANPVLFTIGVAMLRASRVAGIIAILGGLILAALGIFWR